MKELLEAGVHFGHQPQRWNPKMKGYIFGERDGIYIIDLKKTATKFNEAYEFLKKITSEGQTVLFVGTKPQAQDVIVKESSECGMYYVSQRWLGGMLTNFETIKKSIVKLKKFEEMLSGNVGLVKKESLRLDKKRAKMDKTLSGIKEMRGLPGAVVIIDPRKEKIAVEEALKLDIPIVSLIDTNCNPDGISYLIPGNDDSIRSISLIISKLGEAIKEGVSIKKKKDEIRAKERAANASKNKPTKKGGYQGKGKPRKAGARPDGRPNFNKKPYTPRNEKVDNARQPVAAEAKPAPAAAKSAAPKAAEKPAAPKSAPAKTVETKKE